MGGNCDSDNVVYQVNIYPKEGHFYDKIYIGISSLKWKFRWCNHKQSFANPLIKNQTALSKYYGDLIDRGLIPQINWKIIKKFSSTSCLNN